MINANGYALEANPYQMFEPTILCFLNSKKKKKKRRKFGRPIWMCFNKTTAAIWYYQSISFFFLFCIERYLELILEFFFLLDKKQTNMGFDDQTETIALQ